MEPPACPPAGCSSPSGRTVAVGDFPLGLCLSPDGRFAVASCSGERGVGLSVVDLRKRRSVGDVSIPGTWLGVTFADSGRRLVAPAGLRNVIRIFDFAEGRATLSDSIVIGPPWDAGGQYPQGKRIDYGPGAIWPTGLACDDRRGWLYAVTRLDSSLVVMDLRSRQVLRRVSLGAVPFTCRASADGRHVYVSLWSAARVAIVDPEAGRIERTVAVGDHPCDLVESPDGTRLFVANANENTVSVVDLASGRTRETLRTTAERDAPSGSTPNAVALDGDGRRLVIANADENCLVVFDVSRPWRSRPLGFLPVGWYPTAVQIEPRTGTIVVANGKGTGSSPSSLTPPDTGQWCGYLSYRLLGRGALSILPAPDGKALARGTRRVLANRPASEPRGGTESAIPAKPGGRTPIRYVFYVFKENRSYDQVLGDMPRGNGDSTLCLFGERVSPNHHALAREFVLFDNTHVEADGSADGHNWGMAAYSSDYVTKSIATSPIYDYEGGNPHASPGGGYLWDACRRAGVSYRSYGEFVFNPDDPADTVRAGVPSLEGHTAPHYRGYDTHYSDLDRVAAWEEEFSRYEREGGLPQLSILRLSNDHTEGTCSGRPTPRAFVAQNDLALGRIVERISHSRFWNESAIFVIEDDAANGPDHVDAHRTVALVASPYARRGVVDSRLYTNSGMLRTIELILGLQPMSRFDAAALPMRAAFTATPDATPYDCQPAQLDLEETNLAGAYGQERCDAMNWEVADAVPPDEVNEILWHAVRGVDAPLPPLVRRPPRLGDSLAQRPARGRQDEAFDDD